MFMLTNTLINPTSKRAILLRKTSNTRRNETSFLKQQTLVLENAAALEVTIEVLYEAEVKVLEVKTTK